jgi:glycerophosphoryl diester phosphodiesterase
MAPMIQPDKQSSALPVLAHRGYAARYPENTREAIAAAVAAGARHIEFDIQLSADKVPFLLHDADFERTGAVAKRIFDLDAQQVAALRVGEPARFGDDFSEVTAPRLAEVVDDLVGWPSVTAFVELKRQSIGQFGQEAVLDAVLSVLQPVLARCVIISFDLGVIAAARQRNGCRIGWALSAWNSETQQQAIALAPEFLFCNVKRLPPAPEPLWSGNWTWVVYEITVADHAHELARRGVGMIESMAYAELAAGLAQGRYS